MKPRWLLVLYAALAFSLCACFVFWFARSRMGEAGDSQSREAAFQELFGFPAPGDVSNVTSSWYRSGSVYIRWIRVGCGAQTIERIRSLARVTPSRFQIFHTPPGMPEPPRGAMPRLWISSQDAVPRWWSDATDLPHNPERFTLGGQTAAKQDLVFVWLDSSTGVVYAARNVSEYK